MNDFCVTFRGVRGSYPTPEKNKLKYGGNTACVEVKIGKQLIIIDAGTGIISLGDNLLREHLLSGSDEYSRKKINATILLSHTHQDHIQGLPFFNPIYIGSTNLDIFGSDNENNNLKNTLSLLTFDKMFPLTFDEMPADINIRNFHEKTFLSLDPDSDRLAEIKQITSDDIQNPDMIEIRCFKSYAHPKEGVLIFKISYKNKTLIYASDKESYIGGDKKLIQFCRNADVLIHDANYTKEDYLSATNPKQGFGHSTPDMAVKVAQMANVSKLYLFHIGPSYNDETVDEIEKQLDPYFIEIINYLIKNGANINGSKENRKSIMPIHLAAGTNTAILSYLIKNGADINIQDEDGNTPLFWAYGGGNKEAVDILIKAGANKDIKNKNGSLYYQVKSLPVLGINTDFFYSPNN